MKYLPITLTTQSYTLIGSGEGGALIDTELITDEHGFPIFPGRTLRGLLKESFQEILEMSNNENSSLITSLFGEEGYQPKQGKLITPHLKVKGIPQEGNELTTFLKTLEPNSQERIREYFTAEIRQTAIEENPQKENYGSAKEGSLRNYLVLKPNIELEGRIEFNSELNEYEENLLKNALTNLRYCGTRRNRGLGKIKICHGDINELKEEAANNPANTQRLHITIKTLSPVVLGAEGGNPNVVNTETALNGNRIRGILAAEYIRKKKLGQNAHLDSLFRNLFLSGEIKFQFAWLSGTRSIPMNFHEEKGSLQKKYCDVFHLEKMVQDELKREDSDCKALREIMPLTRPLKKGRVLPGKTTEEWTRTEPASRLWFHNVRQNNRTAGKSTQEEGAIFHYEALIGGQEFETWIEGNAELIKEMLNTLPPSFRTRIGKSRSAHFGEVEITLKPENKDNEKEKPKGPLFNLFARSPLIVLNKFGYPEPTGENLLNALPAGTKILHSACGHTIVEHYNQTWGARSGRLPAFETGSTWQIQLPENLTDWSFLTNGIGSMRNLGYGKIMLDEMKEIKVIHSMPLKENPPALQELNTTDLMKKIIDYVQEYEKLTTLKNNGLEAAKQAFEKEQIRINNHLIGRIMLMLKTLPNSEKWNEQFKELKEKTAGKALENNHLFEKLKSGKKKSKEEKDDANWENFQTYWKAYFSALHKLNKKIKQN